MSNVFYIDSDNKDNINNQLASVAYVNSSIKKLQDLIAQYISNIDDNTNLYSQNINFTDSVDNIPMPKQDIDINIDAVDINTDSKHKFISDTEISILKDKASIYDVDNAIANLKKEIMIIINERFDNIINSKDSLNTVKHLLNLLEDDANMKKILDFINTKASSDDLKEHTESFTHLTNVDRKAINLLISFISKGCADWNADKDQPNYIRNKPTSLPANGGNADTVSGYDVEYLINRQFEDFIIGTKSKNNGYIENEVDIMLSTKEETTHFFNKIKREGIYSFRSGYYNIESVTIENIDKECDIIIRGAGSKNTVFIIDKAFNLGINSCIEDLCIMNSNVNISSLSKCNNVLFKNCTISFFSSNETSLTNCIFNNCSFAFNGACYNNIITGCRFKNSGLPSYAGGNNLFNNNLVY